MVHPIFVCLEHKLTMHTCRNAGTHSLTYHKMDYHQLLEKRILVEIGECNPPNNVWRKCASPKDRPATNIELKIAEEKAKKE